MNIDPRLVSTPIGAALGVLIARRVLEKKDHTMKNMLIGGGIGGGAGFLAGQFMKGEPGDISTKEGYIRYLSRQKPSGQLSKQEIEAVDKMFDIYGGIPATGGWPLGRIRRNLAEDVAPVHEAAAGYKARALGYETLAADPSLDDYSRKEFQDLAAKSLKQHDTAKSERRFQQFTSPIANTKSIIGGLLGLK